MGDYEAAVSIFNGMLEKFSDDGDAITHVNYCLAWIEVQQGKYNEAIERLRKTLAEVKCSDKELPAETHFMIGRIYYAYLLNETAAMRVFREIRDFYPDTGVADHPYLMKVQ